MAEAKKPEIVEVTIGAWADFIDLDWSREEDREQLRELFPAWIIERVTEQKDH